MKLQSRLRLIKYELKSQVLSRRPAAYWTLRHALKGDSEPELALVARLAESDMMSIDVGAHFGIYTYAMSRKSSWVHAFEVVPRLAATLESGYRGDNVTIHRGALSNDIGTVEVRIPLAGLGRTTIESSNALAGMKAHTAPVESLWVERRPLDSFGFENVGLIKIDVEGHEECVIRGTLGTLRQSLPALIVELEERHKPGCIAAVTELLTPLGYTRHQWNGHELVHRTTGHNFLFLQPRHLQRLAI